MPRRTQSGLTNWLNAQCCCCGPAELPESSIHLPEEITQLDEKSVEIYKNALSSGHIEDHEVRVMIVGHVGVGKSTLTKRLLGEPVDINERKPTDGIDVHTRSAVSVNDGSWKRFDTGDASKTYSERLAKVLTESNIKEHSEETSTTVDDINEQHITQQDGTHIPEGALQNNSDKEEVNFDITVEQPLLAQTSGEASEKEERLDIQFQGEETSLNLESINGTQHVLFTESDGTEQHQSITEQGLSEQVQPSTSNDDEVLHLKEVTTNSNLEELDDAGQDEGNVLDELKDVVAAAASSTTGENSTMVSIWDFAGDSAFYATHQVFLSKRAVYILVTDMSKHADDIVEDDNQGFGTFGAKSCQVSEFVEFWLNSIHCYCGSSSSNVILVGTHADKLDQRKKKSVVESYFQSVRHLVSGKLLKSQMIVEDQFAIDNAIPDDPELGRLKRKILDVAKEQPYWGSEIPARWIPLEKAFSTLREHGKKILLRTELSDINDKIPVPVETEDEMDLFLIFQHELGTILYFSDPRLREYILLDPQWVIDAMKCIITAKTFCSKKAGIGPLWTEFNSQAILKHKLIEAVWNSKENINFWEHHEYLLELMKKLDLIACSSEKNGANTAEDAYFVPCVLNDPASEDLLKSLEYLPTTSHLCFTTASRYIPTALFNRLLAACITRWPIYKQANKPYIFSGCGIFQMIDNHRLTVYFKQDFIQLWVTRFVTSDEKPDASVCSTARIFIEDSLKRIYADVKNAGEIQQYIKCPKAPLDSLAEIIEVTAFHDTEEIVCISHKDPHMLKSRDMLHSWFEGTAFPGPGPLSDTENLQIMSDNFIRLQTLLVDICTIPLRALFLWEAQKSAQPQYTTLDKFLDYHMTTILKVRPMYPAHKKVMYPPDGSDADIFRWDITLLSALLLKLFPSLPQHVQDNIKSIKDTRNDCQHIGSTQEVDTNTFDKTWDSLDAAISGIVAYLNDDTLEKKLDDKLRKVRNAPIRTHHPKKRSLQQEVQSGQDSDGSHPMDTSTVHVDYSASSVSPVDKAKYLSIRVRKDRYKCRVQGSCPLPDGGFLTTDESNIRLKRMNADFLIVDHIDLPGAPWAVCYNVDFREAAVSMPYETAIQLVSLDGKDMTLSRRIDTHYECKGVACRQDELLWVGQDEGGKLTGIHRNEWKRGIRRLDVVPRRRWFGRVQPKWPRHLAVREDGQVLYLACRDDGLLVIGLDGSLLARVKDLEDTAGVCWGDPQCLFVSGAKKGHCSVLRYDREGRHPRKVLTHEQLRGKMPWCVSYSRSTLVVTWGSDDVAVFHLR